MLNTVVVVVMNSDFYVSNSVPSLKLPNLFVFTPIDSDVALIHHLGTQEIEEFLAFEVISAFFLFQ